MEGSSITVLHPKNLRFMQVLREIVWMITKNARYEKGQDELFIHFF